VGAACDAVAGAARGTFGWFFPPEVPAHDCVLALLRFIYPGVNWSRVRFHDGIPPIINVGQNAITLPSPVLWEPNLVRVFFQSGLWDPCICGGMGRGLTLIVHEGMHVRQIWDTGWDGVGLIRPFIMLYLSCWVSVGFNYAANPLEVQAVAVETDFNGCCTVDRRPCDCSTDPPTLDEAALQRFRDNCPHVVRTSSELSFFGSIAECIPGLQSLNRAAIGLIRNGCKSEDLAGPSIDDEVPIGPVGGTGEEAPPSRVSGSVRKCVLAGLAAVVLWILFALYYLVWLVVWFLVSIVITILKVIVDIVGLLTTGAVWLAAGVTCGVEWIVEQLGQGLGALVRAIKKGLQKACTWATEKEEQCTEWATDRQEKCTKEEDQGYDKCTKEEDQGYDKCNQEEDQGYSSCCDWWPCSWGCKALVWVSNVVCVGWTWVSNLVCVASTWVSHIVCVASTWIVVTTCKAFTWVVKKSTCWAS
jgi:hypothetical protein